MTKKLVRQLQKMSWKTGEQQGQKGKWSNLEDKWRFCFCVLFLFFLGLSVCFLSLEK